MHSISPELLIYAQEYSSPESDLLTQVRAFAATEMTNPEMVSSLSQGRLLSVLAKMLRPKNVLELGTYVGYSALCLAEGLDPKTGKLVTIENSPETLAIAKNFFAQSEYKNLIQARLGFALEVMETLEKESFDLIFVDAKKADYPKYYPLCLELLTVGGWILADNTLWHGQVLAAQAGEKVRPAAQGIQDFNKQVLEDKRVEVVILPFRDGLSLIRKLS